MGITDLEIQSNTNKEDPAASSSSSSLSCSFARGDSSSLSGKVGATRLELSSRFRRSLTTSIMEGRLVGSSHVHIIAMRKAWNMAVLMVVVMLDCTELAIIEKSRSSDGSPLLRIVERTKSTRLPPSTSVLPVGSLPVISSNKMTPKLYTSPRVVDLQNWPYSGGM